MEAIEECIKEPGFEKNAKLSEGKGIPPSFRTLGLTSDTVQNNSEPDPNTTVPGDGELIADDLDDDELDQYILTDKESKFKDTLWMKINENYLQEQKGEFLLPGCFAWQLSLGRSRHSFNMLFLFF